jgi:hypothetical protein
MALICAVGCQVPIEGYEFAATISANQGEFLVDNRLVTTHVWWQRFDSQQQAIASNPREFITQGIQLYRLQPGVCFRVCEAKACFDQRIVSEVVEVTLDTSTGQIRLDGICVDVDGVEYRVFE